MYKFSLIIPCYNIANFKEGLFTSLDKLSENVEVILVDDKSTDDTVELIKKYIKGKKNMQLLEHEVNKRQGGALNTGIKKMSTNWFFRFDPDDLLRDNYEKEITKAIEKNPNAKLIRFKFLFVKNKKIKKPNFFESFFFKIGFGWSCAYNIKLFGKPDFKQDFIMEDLEMFARQYKKSKHKEIFINKYLIEYTIDREDSTMHTVNENMMQDWKEAINTYIENKDIKGIRPCIYSLFTRARIKLINKKR